VDVSDWATEMLKMGGGAVAGVFVGTRRMEARVRALEERANRGDLHAQSQDETLSQLHHTVSADHDLLTKANTKLDLIMDAMALRPKA